MIENDTNARRSARLAELVVADPPGAWRAAGFTVTDDTVTLGTTLVRLVGAAAGTVRSDEEPAPRGGIRSWTLVGLDLPAGLTPTAIHDIDGLPTIAEAPIESTAGAAPSGPGHDHPNGCTGLDHVVVATPDLERTIAALGQVGLACRRIRETESYGSPMRQAFFRLGPTVLEVVSGDTGSGLLAAEAPSTWFGLAIDVIDLDETSGLLGEGLGSIKTAVQDGRRIATFRHKVLGLSIPIAAMDDHAGRPTPDR